MASNVWRWDEGIKANKCYSGNETVGKVCSVMCKIAKEKKEILYKARDTENWGKFSIAHSGKRKGRGVGADNIKNI